MIAGSAVAYTLTLTNNGPSDAAGVTVTDPAVAGLTILSAAPSQGTCTVAANAVNCPLGTVTNRAVGRDRPGVGDQCAGRPLTNTATVTSATTDPTPGQQLGRRRRHGDHASADVALIEVRPTRRRSCPAHPVTYTLTVSNNGPSPAAGVVITDTLPTV